MTTSALTLAELRAAADRISSEAIVTPVVSDPTLDALVGATVHFKVEAAQRAGSFKFRGAFHRLSTIPEADRARGVVAVSSGNHGAAMACAAQILDITAVVLIPEDAPSAKRALMEEFGAEIITFNRATDDREALAMKRVQETGATFVHPFDDRGVMVGQGTAALELHDQVGDLDLLLVPTSGGGLLAGCASAMNALSPGCSMVGVEPEVGDDTQQSFEAGRVVKIEQPKTIADGLAVTSPGSNTFAINRHLVDRIETVSERQIILAMKALHETLGLVIEPSGAVGLAVLMAEAERAPSTGQYLNRKVGVILSGGNIDPAYHRQLIESL
ncbi:MAG: threonine ammonia-lyase [Acidimicrobiales bacterium]